MLRPLLFWGVSGAAVGPSYALPQGSSHRAGYAPKQQRTQHRFGSLHGSLELSGIYADEELSASHDIPLLHRKRNNAPGDIGCDIYRAFGLDLPARCDRGHEVAALDLVFTTACNSVARADDSIASARCTEASN